MAQSTFNWQYLGFNAEKKIEKLQGLIDDLLDPSMELDIECLEAHAAKLRTADNIDDTLKNILNRQGVTLDDLLLRAGIKSAYYYFRDLDLFENYKHPRKILGRFHVQDDLHQFYRHEEKLRRALKFVNTDTLEYFDIEAMNTAIQEKEQAIHFRYAQYYLACLEGASAYNPSISDVRVFRIKPEVGLLRLQFHLDKSGRTYSDLVGKPEEDAKSDINLYAALTWGHRLDPEKIPPQLKDGPVILDKQGRYEGIYVFSRVKDKDIAIARERFLHKDRCLITGQIIEGCNAAIHMGDVTLAEIFNDSGMTDPEVFEMVYEHLVDLQLTDWHYNIHEMSAREKREVIAHHRLDSTIRMKGFNKLAPSAKPI